MKILILGCQGQLGRCLQDQFQNTEHKTIFASREQIDVSEFAKAKKYILDKAPDVVVNATAYTSVDKAESDKQVAEIVNHQAVENIAEICEKIGCWLVHLSTDYVFDGTSDLAYTEEDNTNPQSVYGETKLRGELAIKSSECKHIIIRTAWVFSEYGNNFLKSMLKLATCRDDLHIVDDQIGCPTYSQDIAKAIVCIINKMKSENLDSGMYHFSGNLSCSWAEFSEIIFNMALDLNIIDVKPNVVRVTTQEFPTKAKRPAQSQLNSNKFRDIFGISPSDSMIGIRSSLIAIKNEMNQK